MSVVAALFLLSGGLRTLTTSGISLRLARSLLESTLALGRFPKAMKNPPGADFRVARRVCIRDDTNKNMVAYRLPIFLSFENDGYITRHSRALVSVAAALFLLSGGLRTLTSSGISLRLARIQTERAKQAASKPPFRQSFSVAPFKTTPNGTRFPKRILSIRCGSGIRKAFLIFLAPGGLLALFL